MTKQIEIGSKAWTPNQSEAKLFTLEDAKDECARQSTDHKAFVYEFEPNFSRGGIYFALYRIAIRRRYGLDWQKVGYIKEIAK